MIINPKKKPQKTKNLPVNCISHSRTLSICMLVKSERSSYSSFNTSSVNEKVANPLEASRPAKTPYGEPARKNDTTFGLATQNHFIWFKLHQKLSNLYNPI